MGRKSIYATEEERKAAQKAQKKAWAEANRERCNASSKAWREANKEKCNASNKVWREANKEKHNAASKAWYEANRERCNASSKAWREANKEKCNAASRAWHEANKEKHNAAKKAWNKAHKDHRKTYREDYYKDPFWKEINRIEKRDRKRMNSWSERTGFDITPYELHHIVYHADNDYADWPKDCLLLTPEEHKTWHMEHPEWVATIA